MYDAFEPGKMLPPMHGLFFVPLRGFTAMVAGEGRAHLNQVPWDQWLTVPSKERTQRLSFFSTFGVGLSAPQRSLLPCGAGTLDL